MRTQVAIIGAGPAGLLLGQLLHQRGIESVILEARPREYLEGRVRAGVLEHQSVEILNAAGAGERMGREGLRHEGIFLRFNGRNHHINFADLTGKAVTIYGQQEVVKDLIAARLAAQQPICFEVEDVAVSELDSDQPRVRYRLGGRELSIECDFIAGCDGFHGVCRASIPERALTVYERIYPFAWLGVLAQAPPASHELVYANDSRGFALLSMRSPSVSRLYLQCQPEENLEEWPDDRIWSELRARLGSDLASGPVLQKSVTPMRSFVAEPMRYGRLFLAGDAAHIVPPTGAKGMNLAIADVWVLGQALEAFYRSGSTEALHAFSTTCLERVWKVQRFSWWMTALLHWFHTDNAFDRRRQLAELDYITSSRAAAQTLAENYVGLPLSL